LKIVGICDKDTAIGLRLAGVKDLFIPNEDVLKIWNEISNRNDIGVLIITEKIAEKIGEKLQYYRSRKTFPIIVEIADKQGHIKDHMDYVSYLIKKAVGVEIS
jgi:V/A-type H+-transporting ATPase subunit F